MFRTTWMMFLTVCAAWAAQGFMAQSQQAELPSAADVSKNPIAPIEAAIRSHQYDQALQMSQSALQATPQDFRLWTLEGIIFSIKGSDPDPGDQTAIYHLIVALRHSGQSGQSAEIPVLVKRLGDLQKTARQRETERKKFKLVEQQPLPQP